ncbi:MAG: SPOR domain-containing protein, partial [Alkalispirochaetaceae bacterium]
SITLTPQIPEEEREPDAPGEELDAPGEEPVAPGEEPQPLITEAPGEEPEAPEGEPGVEPPPAEEPAGEAAEGPGEKELFPPAAQDDLFVALPPPERPSEGPLDPELPLAPVGEELEVEIGSVGPRFPNPVELSVTLPQPPDAQTPEVGTLSPRRPEETLPEVRMSAVGPGEQPGPDMREEVGERPQRPAAGVETEIPLRVAEPRVPEGAEDAPITRPSAAPTDEVVALEPAEFRPPEPPRPQAEEEMVPDRPEAESEGPRVSLTPELPEESREEPAEEPAEESREEPAEEPREEPMETEEPAVAEEQPAVEREPPRERGQERPEPVEQEPRLAEEGRELPMSASLGEGYYLQVGAFTSAAGARSAVDRLETDFPVTVVPTDGELYRVFVGPLAEDERGAVLYLVRAQGYRDAFLRREDG